MGSSSEFAKEAFSLAVESALELGDVDRAEHLIAAVEALPPGRRPRLSHAQAVRFRARIASLRRDADEAEHLFMTAVSLFRELGVVFYLAVAQLELGEWLRAQGRDEDAEPLFAEARDIFERLQAQPWLERLETFGPRRDDAAVTASG
jgi:tetratricopeptide (TPR) repeat protein